MNYYIDTEFHEYHKQQTCLGIKTGKPIPTIDLISIGIVSEDVEKTLMPPTDVYAESVNTHDSYYAISKDFNIKDAWNSYQIEITEGVAEYQFKNYWLRENVLKPIFKELFDKEYSVSETIVISSKDYYKIIDAAFNLKNFTKLINKYGKTNKQIADEIREFIHKDNDINFYAYYADYDWVVFCQLFGKMNDLPTGFPKYCRDLKQELDTIKLPLIYTEHGTRADMVSDLPKVKTHKFNTLKEHPIYPKQDNEHNALDDARWNKKLHNFIKHL
jgi:hypothetical protein